jgi:hypothetical protein
MKRREFITLLGGAAAAWPFAARAQQGAITCIGLRALRAETKAPAASGCGASGCSSPAPRTIGYFRRDCSRQRGIGVPLGFARPSPRLSGLQLNARRLSRVLAAIYDPR